MVPLQRRLKLIEQNAADEGAAYDSFTLSHSKFFASEQKTDSLDHSCIEISSVDKVISGVLSAEVKNLEK
jgi:hypothetical protein